MHLQNYNKRVAVTKKKKFYFLCSKTEKKGIIAACFWMRETQKEGVFSIVTTRSIYKKYSRDKDGI